MNLIALGYLLCRTESLIVNLSVRLCKDIDSAALLTFVTNLVEVDLRFITTLSNATTLFLAEMLMVCYGVLVISCLDKWPFILFLQIL